MTSRVFRIATIGGIEIKVHWSWFLFLLIVTFDVAVGYFPSAMPGESTLSYWLLGVVAALLLFLSVLLHELSHSFTALARHVKVRDITLFIFGGASNIEGDPEKPLDEFLIAVVGPLTSLLLAGAFFVLGLLVTPPVHKAGAWAAATFQYMAFINFILGLFNLIPGFPLDGGRVLRSILWAFNHNFDTATRWASAVGELVAYGFIFWGLYESFFSENFGGLSLAFIGWFLLNAAQQTSMSARIRDAVRGATVKDVMEPSPPSVGPGYTIAHLLSQYFLPRSLRMLPVVDGERLVGVVTLSAIKDIPQEEWGTVTAANVMATGERLQVARPQDRLEDLMHLFDGGEIDQLPVVDNTGHLVGLLTQAHLLKWLQVKEQLKSKLPPGPDGASQPAQPPEASNRA